jgi:hypothetical protein
MVPTLFVRGTLIRPFFELFRPKLPRLEGQNTKIWPFRKRTFPIQRISSYFSWKKGSSCSENPGSAFRSLFGLEMVVQLLKAAGKFTVTPQHVWEHTSLPPWLSLGFKSWGKPACTKFRLKTWFQMGFITDWVKDLRPVGKQYLCLRRSYNADASYLCFGFEVRAGRLRKQILMFWGAEFCSHSTVQN